MPMKNYLYLFILFGFITFIIGCQGKANPSSVKTERCTIKVENASEVRIESCWVDAGEGYVEFLGNIIPGAYKEYMGFGCLPGSSVHLKWKLSQDPQTYECANVLVNAVQKGANIHLIINSTNATGKVDAN